MKLFASDFDGTFYFFNDEETFNENVKAAQQFQKENKFIFVTGRDLRSILSNLKDCTLKPDYFACFNGARIFDKDINEIYSQKLEIDFFKFEKAINDMKTLRWFIFSDEKVYCQCFRKESEQNAWINRYAERLGVSFESDLNTMNGNAYMMTLVYDTEEEAHDAASQLEKMNLDCRLHINKTAIDITSKEVGKEKAVAFMKDYIGADKVGVIGDSYNDVEMIRQFKGFTVSSANEDIQKEATHIVKSVSEALSKM